MKEKSCGAIVYKIENNELKFLLVYQENGHYSFPKGHVENNETEVETSIREIKEETNLDVNIDTNFRHVITYYLDNECVYKDVVYYIATPVSFDLKSQEGEIRECSWNNYNETLDKLEYDNIKEVFMSANEYIMNKEKLN